MKFDIEKYFEVAIGAIALPIMVVGIATCVLVAFPFYLIGRGFEKLLDKINRRL